MAVMDIDDDESAAATAKPATAKPTLLQRRKHRKQLQRLTSMSALLKKKGKDNIL